MEFADSPLNASQPTPARGRRRFTTEEKTRILERYRDSGLSQAKFSESEGIAVGTLARWLRQNRETGVNGSPGTAVELGRLAALSGGANWAEVVRPDGWRIRLSGACDAASLRTLFSSLPPCSS